MAFDMPLFTTMAQAAFINTHPSLPVPHAELYPEVIDQFKVNDLSTVVEEFQRFQEWIKTWRLKIDMPQVESMTVAIQAKAGDGFINLQLHARFGVDFATDGIVETKATQRAINAAAGTMLHQLFETLEHLRTSNAVPPPSQNQTQGGSKAQNGVGADMVLGETLVVDAKDGKLAYKIRGGKYMKFGAAVYPEVLKAAGVQFEALAVGIYPLGRQVHIIENDRGYAKVIKID